MELISDFIAIGDIHGEIDKLNNLLGKIKPTFSQTLVFLGDYIDRGKDSAAVVERLLTLKDETNCIFLKGNHEQMLLKALKTLSEEDVADCVVNGGAETLKQYLLMKKNNIDKFREHIIFFKNLKNYYMTDEFIFVHAGLNPNKHILEQAEDDFLWIREDFLNKKINVKQKIIFGHTVFDGPYMQDNKIGINTGCGIYKKAPLIAYFCKEKKFIKSDF